MNAKYNSHEVEVLGDFGSFSHLVNNEPTTYSAYKVTFKFPQEHYVDKEKHFGEM